MNPVLEQLHDIEGLDPISMWPLAIGWWILIGLGILLVGAGVVFLAFRIAFKRSWRSDALQKLADLEMILSEATAKDVLILLSEYMRRIALRRYMRKECASLMGNAWLKWLTEHDPKHFDWEKKGLAMIRIPYAPADVTVPVKDVQDLLKAARYWVG